MQAGANEAASQFNIKKQEIELFQQEINLEGNATNEKAKELMSFKEKMQKISEITFEK